MAFKADLKAAFVANFVATPRARLIDAFATAYGYSAFLADGVTANPQTKADFAVDKIVEYIQNVVKGEEAKAAHTAVVTPVAPTIT